MEINRMKRAVKLTKSVSSEPEVQEIEDSPDNESLDDEIAREAENLADEISDEPDFGNLFNSTDEESGDEEPQTTIPQFDNSDWYDPGRTYQYVTDNSLSVDEGSLRFNNDPGEDNEE